MKLSLAGEMWLFLTSLLFHQSSRFIRNQQPEHSDEIKPTRLRTMESCRNLHGKLRVGHYVLSTYYQTCDLKLTTSSYTTYEIRLQMVKNVVNLDFYTKNGEWELLSATGMQSDDKARGGESFSSLTFRFHLRRRPLFHVLNTMFPVALMALLIPLTFKLHVDSGEKIGYSLTVLLAYAVYLSVISENIPSTSVSVCYMCKSNSNL